MMKLLVKVKASKTMIKQVILHKSSRFLPLNENKISTFKTYTLFKTCSRLKLNDLENRQISNKSSINKDEVAIIL